MYRIIGDVHSCYDELVELLKVTKSPDQVIFCGDLIDRGPKPVETLELVMDLVDNDLAQCVMGNHDDKFLRALKGNKVKLSHGLERTMRAMERTSKSFKNDVADFLESLPYKLVLDDGKLVVCHAGLSEKLQKEDSKKARSFALYGDTDGKVGIDGYPNRNDWAMEYRGSAVVVHGHTPMKEARCLNNVWCIDTGVPFGHKMTCLLYPEMKLVSVKAREVYQEREGW